MQFDFPYVSVSTTAQPFDHKGFLQKVKSNFNAFVRNRKFHFLLASIAFVIAVYHTFAFKGITIDNYSRRFPIRDFNYLTASETISFNRAVSDIRIQKCLRGFDCGVPKSRNERTFWEKKRTRLNLFSEGFGLFDYFLLVEKTQMVDADRYVVDIMFTSEDKQPSTTVGNSKFTKLQISPSGFVWLNYVEELDLVTPVVRDINVFYGKEDMKDSRKHWKFEPGVIPIPGKHSLDARISMLRVKVMDESHILREEQEFQNVWKKDDILLNIDPKFKIMQLSDLHIGQDTGVCYEDCKFDIDTLKFVESAIKKEGDVKLIVITGDLIDNRRTTHFPSAFLKALSPILESGIPFVFTFGDRDYINYTGPRDIMDFISSLPGCFNKKPDQMDYRIGGLTNGNLKIYNLHGHPVGSVIDVPNLSQQHADALVTYLDSSWGSIRDSQAAYLYRLNHKAGMATDFKLLFAHHPLPNFRPDGVAKLIGSYNEKHEMWTGTDKKILDDIKASGYKAVAVGHEHENDACIWDEKDDQKILLCYSGVTGEAGRTRIDPGFKRRLRIFEFDFENNKIYSWKRDPEMSIDPQEIWAGVPLGDELPELPIVPDLPVEAAPAGNIEAPVKDKSDETPDDGLDAAAGKVSEIPNEVSEEATEKISEEATEEISKEATEEISKEATEEIPEEAPEKAPERVSEKANEAPKKAQEALKKAQEAPKKAKEAPKKVQEAPALD